MKSKNPTPTRLRWINADEAMSGQEATSIASIVDRAPPCQPDHPYLRAKGLTGAHCKVCVDVTEINGIQCHRAIVIPVYNIGGDIVNVQFIVQGSDGEFIELYAPDTPPLGCFARIGNPTTGTILVTSNWASGMSLHLATNHAVAVALAAENMIDVCKGLAARHSQMNLIVCADDDGSAPESKLDLAIAAANAIGGFMAMPQFASIRDNRLFDFNELHRLEGLDAVRHCVESVADPTNSSGPIAVRKEVMRLASLGSVEYEQQRTKSAKSLGLRATFLDELVKEERTRRNAITKRGNSNSTDMTIYPESVDGSELAAQLCHTIARFTVLPPYSVIAMMLWIVSAHLMQVMQVSPILVLFSPEKRCGKTTTLRLIELMTPQPITASNITSAALFRTIQLMTPTLVIDEADTFIRKSEELNGIINSGHTRSNAYVIRVEDGVPRRFSTWCAKAVAMIGEPPETMYDRSIVINLRRKQEDEHVESLRHTSEKEFSELKSKIARWARDNAEQLTKQRPVNLDISNDRAKDNWEPLLLIASCMGKDWLNQAVAAAIEMAKEYSESRSIGEELLLDIRHIFQAKETDKIQSVELIQLLCSDDEKPWKTFSHGRPISTRDLSSLLKKFGIRSKNLRYGREVVKGYEVEQFYDAFARYLPKRAD